jgi:hypothetical protein
MTAASWSAAVDALTDCLGPVDHEVPRAAVLTRIQARAGCGLVAACDLLETAVRRGAIRMTRPMMYALPEEELVDSSTRRAP